VQQSKDRFIEMKGSSAYLFMHASGKPTSFDFKPKNLGLVSVCRLLDVASPAHFPSICSLILALPETRDHHLMKQQDAEQSRR